MLFEGGFIVTIVMVCTAGWLINNWIRARHGYPLEDEWSGLLGRKHLDPHNLPVAESEETRRLREENRMLHDKLDTVQDRLVVLERIVTDRGYSLSAEIEALRDPPATGVPTTPTGRERV